MTGSLSFTGAGTTVTLGRAGQQAELTFAVTAGQRIGIGFTGSTFAAGTTATTKVLEPNGAPTLWSNASDRGLVGITTGNDLDITVAETGTYTILFGSTNSSTGSVTVTVSAELNVGAFTFGTSKTIAISRPGQDARATFAGTAGQRLSLDITAYSFGFLPFVAVFRPDGTLLQSGTVSGFHLDLQTLPTTGTYAVTFSPFSSTGSLTARITERTDAGTITSTGPSVTVPFAVAGRTVELSFATTAGQSLAFGFTNWALPAGVSVRAIVVDPSGVAVVRILVGSLGTFRFTPASTGTYRLTLTPDDGASTGSATVTLSDEIAGGALSIGVAKTISATRIGQPTRVTVAGAAGQRLSLSFASFTFPHTIGVQVLRPDGTVFRDGTLAQTQLDLEPLNVAGTYQIVLYPFAETGSTQLTLLERIDYGATLINGAATTLTASPAFRYAETSFTATAGERISFGFTGWTFPAGTTLRARLLNATGAAHFDLALGNGGAIDTTIPAAGTYRLVIGPPNFSTGSVTLTLSDQIDAGTIVLNTPKGISAPRAGQSSRMTYAGTAGQNLSLVFSSVTLPFYPNVVVRRPDGTLQTQHGGGACVPVGTLPTTGTYEIVINPYSFTGSANVTAALGACFASGTIPSLLLPTPPTVVPFPVLNPVPSHGGTGLPELLPTPPRTDFEDPSLTPPTPLLAPPGTTALAGRVKSATRSVRNVTVQIGKIKTKTDQNGQFLLSGLSAGHAVLRVDGGATFGLYDIGVDVFAGKTTTLGYPIWLTPLDTEHTVTFPSPTTEETVITTPEIPGLEVHLPAGAVVRDTAGKVVTSLGITKIPVERPPFPLPSSHVPAYFTVQPGSSYVYPEGARVIYPNFTHAAPGAKMDFWHYEPGGRGWFVYGQGTVMPDGQRVEPDPGVEVYQFTGAMLITPGADPPPATAPRVGGGARGGDPVDLGTGLLVDKQTDLVVDDVVPLEITRTYQQSDIGRRPFGIGVNSNYDLYLYSQQQWVEADLVLPDGGKVHFRRITPGSSGTNEFRSAVFRADPTPTEFKGSILAWNGDGWDLRLRDGTTYVIGNESPLQAIRDKFGNTVTITRAPAAPEADGRARAKGPITQVTSPNGRKIVFGRDASNRVTSVTDDAGRTVSYTYDATGHLATVTDATGGLTTYTYDTAGRLASIRDPRDIVYLTNTYDVNGRVATQTAADGTRFQFAYTLDAAGKVIETLLTDPRGNVRRVGFNAAGFPISDTAAFGTPSAQTVQITRDATSNRPTSVIDPLGRRTDIAYDANGNPTTVTELAGTASARTTQIAYGGPLDQISQITDGLGHTTRFTYATSGLTAGALTSVIDGAGRTTTKSSNETGQMTAVTDALAHTTTYGYVLGVPATVTDALGRVNRTTMDAVGRIIAETDPTGAVTKTGYDNADRVKSIVDPLGRTTQYAYDANGNLTAITDARAHNTFYGYNTMDRLTSITDPLGRIESYTYDGGGNLTGVTGRRGLVTAYAYDVLDRLTSERYGVSGATEQSRVDYTYDAGNRVTAVVDSAAGTSTFTLDGLDRLTRAVTAQGQIDYTYDAADRRTAMTVAGQPVMTYTYNNANQLTALTRGSDTVAISYDVAGRRTSQTLPGQVGESYAYDVADQVTSITYTGPATTLGNLTYAYDAAGHPIHVDGSYARADVPAAFGPATYDNANRLTALGATTYTYDNDGNLTSEGATTYTWNARGQLASWAKPGLSVSYGYDSLSRRVNKTVGGVSTRYLYDGINTVQEQNGSGSPVANLLTGGIDEVFARTTTGTRALLTDIAGSTLGLVDAAGTVTGEYSYSPFGATTLTGDDAGNPSRFTGREDDGSGLYYYRSRYYSTATQRFLSEDPLGVGGGDTNLYAYVTNQPTHLTDPLGTKPRGPRNKKSSESSHGDPNRNRCKINSFTPDTRVVMADGSSKPISQIKPGDQVLSADLESNVDIGVAARPVTATITGTGDKQLFDISIESTQGTTASVTATDGHPFWVDADGRADTPGGQWINAADLRQGQWLKTSDGKLVRVAGTHAHAQYANVYNLTVAGLHTYYVLAGSTAVLVHNAGGPGGPGCGDEGPEADAVNETTPYRAGMSRNPLHHLFPRAHRAWFRARGFDIDKVTVRLDEATHQAIHGGGNWRLGRTWDGEWNNQIMRRLMEREAELGRQLTPKEIFKIGYGMARQYGLPRNFVPYGG
ncbi:MAG TPA: RHS repeat-associated core domain-containing protein [Candidatus Limnocylindrales bacterium]|nr:RHS repeat-associated core domain-containing protein [Candidatus Limnocylindrales bacterium]